MYKLPNEANFSDWVCFGNRLHHKLLDGRVSHIVTWLRFSGLASFWAVCMRPVAGMGVF
jgi:hypothetical protein